MEKGNEEIALRKKKAEAPSLLRKMALLAIFTAIMAVLSPLSIPLEPVSITLATFALYLIGALLPLRYSYIPILLYLSLGFMGLPVFSKFQAGPTVILGPSGGFLIGYLPCVFLESLIIAAFKKKRFAYPLAMSIGTILLYAVGVLWITLYAGYDVSKAFLLCVLPFLPGDLTKVVLASLLSWRLEPLVAKRLQ